MKSILFVLLTLSISTFAFAEGGLPNQPYLYVEGKAEIEKPADMVTLSFEVQAAAPDQAKANQEVQALAVKIFSILRGNKVADNDAIAEDLRSEPQFEEKESVRSENKVIGYKVKRPFQVKIRDVNVFPKVVDELLAMNGVQFYSIEPGLLKEREVQDQLSEKALANARERAEKSLKGIGMKIDSVFAVSPVPFPDIQHNIFRGGVPDSERVMVTAAVEYHLGPVTLNQSVHAIYLISPAK